MGKQKIRRKGVVGNTAQLPYNPAQPVRPVLVSVRLIAELTNVEDGEPFTIKVTDAGIACIEGTHPTLQIAVAKHTWPLVRAVCKTVVENGDVNTAMAERQSSIILPDKG